MNFAAFMFAVAAFLKPVGDFLARHLDGIVALVLAIVILHPHASFWMRAGNLFAILVLAAIWGGKNNFKL